MSSFRPRRKSPALIVAVVALLAALGGTSYAAFSLPKNSVGTKQLENNAVTTSKIKNGAVTGVKMDFAGVTVPNATNAGHANSADSATNASKANQASTADKATNATNATTASNALSLGGATSSSFLRRTVTAVADGSVANGGFDVADALCPAGYEAVGGGVEPNNVLTMSITASEPLLSDVSNGYGIFSATPGQHAYAKGWRAWVVNNSGSTQGFAVAAICAQIGP